MHHLLAVLYFLSIVTVACSTGTDKVTSDQSNAVAKGEHVEDRLSIWDVSPNPEGVAIGKGLIYATHFGDALKPTDQDGDGYIATYDANGSLISKFVSGLDAPKGIEVVDNQVFVADIDSLIGFSTKNGSRTVSVSFTGKAQFLNGLAAKDGQHLYVSATDAGMIWEVDLSDGSISEVASVPSCNGLAVSQDGSVIYAVQYNGQSPEAGRLLAVNPQDGTSIPLGDYSGLLDGVVEYKGAVYFTDWNPNGFGRVLRYDLMSSETTVVVEDSRLQGPADFEVLGDGLALIPMLTGSSIVGVRLK